MQILIECPHSEKLSCADISAMVGLDEDVVHAVRSGIPHWKAEPALKHLARAFKMSHNECKMRFHEAKKKIRSNTRLLGTSYHGIKR